MYSTSTLLAIILLRLGENLKALEVAEEKAQQREEEYKKQVLHYLHISKIKTGLTLSDSPYLIFFNMES